MNDDNVRIVAILFVTLALAYFVFRLITDWRKDELVEHDEKVFHPEDRKETAPSAAVVASTATAKKSASSKPLAKKSVKKAVKKTTTKKASSKKVVAKKPAPKKTVAKKKATPKTTKTQIAKKPGSKKKTSNKKPAPARKKAAPRKQDLTKIEGIGPKIAKLLNDADIKTYDQLAGSKKAELQEILKKGGSRFASHDPSTWSRQSNLASQDRWDELKKLQDKL